MNTPPNEENLDADELEQRLCNLKLSSLEEKIMKISNQTTPIDLNDNKIISPDDLVTIMKALILLKDTVAKHCRMIECLTQTLYEFTN
jgi:hypothetical protein